MTAEPHIDYEALAQVAMRSMVRMVLARVAKTGLPGEHHFYIAFDTQAPGVSISKRLREKYPKEMTVVLQHRFWDLGVSDDRFEVKLTFDGIPERLSVPFAAIKVFFDPSVPYGLQFEDSDLAGEPLGSAETTTVEAQPGKLEKKPRVPRKPRAEKAAEPPRPERPVGRPQIVATKPESGDASNENKVVSIDAFRKK
ncbi:MAG TPA: ClpXP protease specificity-enhancing factor SspB [Hyphomicrobiaceae bacterium]|nr:ClpXP protease specificity-enhancing factor SspB [Hyphomicrobiaceae bacterium]